MRVQKAPQETTDQRCARMRELCDKLNAATAKVSGLKWAIDMSEPNWRYIRLFLGDWTISVYSPGSTYDVLDVDVREKSLDPDYVVAAGKIIQAASKVLDLSP